MAIHVFYFIPVLPYVLVVCVSVSTGTAMHTLCSMQQVRVFYTGALYHTYTHPKPGEDLP